MVFRCNKDYPQGREKEGEAPRSLQKATDDDNKGGATGQGLIRWSPGNNDDQARSQQIAVAAWLCLRTDLTSQEAKQLSDPGNVLRACRSGFSQCDRRTETTTALCTRPNFPQTNKQTLRPGKTKPIITQLCHPYLFVQLPRAARPEEVGGLNQLGLAD